MFFIPEAPSRLEEPTLLFLLEVLVTELALLLDLGTPIGLAKSGSSWKPLGAEDKGKQIMKTDQSTKVHIYSWLLATFLK